MTVPARRPGRPKDVDAAATRQRLLDVARAAFATDGFDATTNKQIAAAAGITPGAIYHYFDSKAELYADVYGEVLEVVYGAFERALASQDTLVAQLLAVLDTAVTLNQADSSVSGFVVKVSSEVLRHPELRPLLAKRVEPERTFLAHLVDDARARHELADTAHPQGVQDLFTAILTGLAQFGMIGDADRHARAVETLKLLVAGDLFRR